MDTKPKPRFRDVADLLRTPIPTPPRGTVPPALVAVLAVGLLAVLWTWPKLDTPPRNALAPTAGIAPDVGSPPTFRVENGYARPVGVGYVEVGGEIVGTWPAGRHAIIAVGVYGADGRLIGTANTLPGPLPPTGSGRFPFHTSISVGDADREGVRATFTPLEFAPF